MDTRTQVERFLCFEIELTQEFESGREKMKNRLSSQFNLKIGSGIISKSVIDIIPKWRTTGAKLAHIQDNAMVLQQFCTTLESTLLLFTIFTSIY